MSVTLSIASLGAQGDGLAFSAGKQVFVPFTLPGEKVRASLDGDRAEPLDIIEPSPDRVSPPCGHFGDCGGCAMQHADLELYDAWKRDRLVAALKGRGLDVPVEPTMRVPAASRRRITLSARATEAGMLLGFNAAMSHRIVDIGECVIAVPLIAERLATLREAARLACATGKAFRLTVTATGSGLDLAFSGSGTLPEKARHALVAFAATERLARISVDGETVIEPVRPIVAMGRAAVSPPSGAFLQAVAEAEDWMAGLAIGHLKKAKKVADLFAGCGAFALRLAEKASVHAVEGEAAALASLDRGFRETPGLRTVTHERRDLYRRPLTARELDRFDGVVFDPPRAGAEDQAKQMARSSVPLVAAVSCNPVTLARDLSILVEGGYRVTRVVPIDQFLWSPHLEAVALLEKPRRRR